MNVTVCLSINVSASITLYAIYAQLKPQMRWKQKMDDVLSLRAKRIPCTPAATVKSSSPADPAAHTFANGRPLCRNNSVFFGRETQIWHFTWQEVGRGKNPFLNLPAFAEKFLRRHGKIQSVPDYLTSLQRISSHHQRLHGPCVLLFEAVTYFLEGHGVQPLCVWNEKKVIEACCRTCHFENFPAMSHFFNNVSSVS